MNNQNSRRELLKEKLIFKRLERVYCRLQPSPLHGVGIFAIRKINKGSNPFRDSYMAQGAILVNKNRVNEVYEKLLEDYHPSEPSGSQRILSDYPNQPIWTNYLNYVNEGNEPNIQLMQDGEWRVLRDIEVGEELLEDPKRLFNSDGSHKSFKLRPGQYPSLT